MKKKIYIFLFYYVFQLELLADTSLKEYEILLEEVTQSTRNLENSSDKLHSLPKKEVISQKGLAKTKKQKNTKAENYMLDPMVMPKNTPTNRKKFGNHYACRNYLKSNCIFTKNKTTTHEVISCLSQLTSKSNKKISPSCRNVGYRFISKLKKKESSGYQIKLFLIKNRVTIILLTGIIFWMQFCFSILLERIGINPAYGFLTGYNFYLFHKLSGVPHSWVFLNLTPALLYYWPQTCMSFVKKIGKESNFGIKLSLLPFVYLFKLANDQTLDFKNLK